MNEREIRLQELDAVTINIENVKLIIKDIETDIAYKQKEIAVLNERVTLLEGNKKNLELQLKPEVAMNVIEAKPITVSKKGRK